MYELQVTSEDELVLDETLSPRDYNTILF